MKKLIFIIFTLFLNITNSALANKPTPHFSDLSIITVSSDPYHELWDMHYHFLFQNWPELKTDLSHIPIYLISNKLSFEKERVNNFQTFEDISWSDNLLNFLKTVKSKYVLILLEDYIINRPVNNKRLLELYEFLKSEDGAYLQLFIKSDKKEYDFSSKIQNVIKRSQDGPYRNSLQSAIWNREELMNLIKPGESAWEFELIGNSRSQKMSKPFFAITKDPAIEYLNCVEKRMYVKECLQETSKLGYELNPKKMPVYSQKKINKIRKKQSKF